MKGKSISEIMHEVHANAREHGWWDAQKKDDGSLRAMTADEVLAKLMLVVSELSEAVEIARMPHFDPTEVVFSGFPDLVHQKPEGFGVEIADAVIRIMDLCGAMGVDLERLVELKHEYNKTRPMRHGNKRA